MVLDKTYWTSRYENQSVGWDIGYVSTPLKTYIDQLSDKEIRILIPGAGNSYEAEYLYGRGFHNVYVCDLSPIPLQRLRESITDIPESRLIEGDFFELEGQYDLILEQTFFCALNVDLRSNYIQKMHQLLVPKGQLVGVLFNRHFDLPGPPFGGSLAEYRFLFASLLDIDIMEPCYNSIPARSGSELFIRCIKPSVTV